LNERDLGGYYTQRVLALPAGSGRTAVLLLALGAVLGLGVFAVGWPRLRARFSYDRLRALAVGLALLGLCSAVTVVPYNAWRIADDIGHTSSLTRSEAEATGASLNSLSPDIFDDLRREIPPGDTYYVDAASRIASPPRDAFLEWSATALLPRLPVRTPERADWIVTWGIPPGRYHIPLGSVRVFARASARMPETYLARVAS
jgi:hypothetical protein